MLPGCSRTIDKATAAAAMFKPTFIRTTNNDMVVVLLLYYDDDYDGEDDDDLTIKTYKT